MLCFPPLPPSLLRLACAAERAPDHADISRHSDGKRWKSMDNLVRIVRDDDGSNSSNAGDHAVMHHGDSSFAPIARAQLTSRTDCVRMFSDDCARLTYSLGLSGTNEKPNRTGRTEPNRTV